MSPPSASPRSAQVPADRHRTRPAPCAPTAHNPETLLSGTFGRVHMAHTAHTYTYPVHTNLPSPTVTASACHSLVALSLAPHSHLGGWQLWPLQWWQQANSLHRRWWWCCCCPVHLLPVHLFGDQQACLPSLDIGRCMHPSLPAISRFAL